MKAIDQALASEGRARAAGGGWIFERMTGAKSDSYGSWAAGSRVGLVSRVGGARLCSVIGAPTTAERTMRA